MGWGIPGGRMVMGIRGPTAVCTRTRKMRSRCTESFPPLKGPRRGPTQASDEHAQVPPRAHMSTPRLAFCPTGPYPASRPAHSTVPPCGLAWAVPTGEKKHTSRPDGLPLTCRLGKVGTGQVPNFPSWPPRTVPSSRNNPRPSPKGTTRPSRQNPHGLNGLQRVQVGSLGTVWTFFT